MNFVDVKNDIAFRKIFGNQNRTEIIISFLNAILRFPQGKKIVKATIGNPYQLPTVQELKSSILDIHVVDQRGVKYIVEMQVEEPIGFDKRVQYYAAKQYASQIEIGQNYPKLNQVIFLGILNFNFFTHNTHYLSRHKVVDIKTRKNTLNAIEYTFIELTKFNKKAKKVSTLSDKWIFFLKNAGNLNVIPSNVKDKGLTLAYEDAHKHNWSKKELLAYDYMSMRKQDAKGVLTLAHERGFSEGIEKGIENERKRSKKIMKEERERQLSIIKKMKADGLPIELILKYSNGLSKSDIEKL